MADPEHDIDNTNEAKKSKQLPRIDSMLLEAGHVSNMKEHGNNQKVSLAVTLSLAFQAFGVVYGDLGTSPLYTFPSTFLDGIKNVEDIYGVLSLMLYTLLLSPLVKYCFIVLRANDNGNGGTFALYSLISQHAKINLIPNQQAEDAMLSNYKLEKPSRQMKRAQWIKEKLERSQAAKHILFLVTILGVAMVIGDGILTPCISVLSAVSGIKLKAKSLTEGQIAAIAIVILIFIFSIQHYGTDKVGYAFGPIILVWFFLVGGIGLYNVIVHGPKVLRAYYPKYIVDYFRRNGKEGWLSLGGVVLCITGTEAMFADLGHFNIAAIQISFTSVLLPAVSLSYMGQAAYLTKHPEVIADSFYAQIPGPLFWPTFVVAILAAIIASQAMISGAFQILSQSQSLGCFPSIKIVRTSVKYPGQVYIPEINIAMMIACVIVTGAFRTTTNIGNAYGIAVVSTEFITTSLVTLIMLLVWKTSMWKVAIFFAVYATVELSYLSAVLSKFIQGGFLPVLFSLFLMMVMSIWHYVHVEKYKYELENKVSNSYIMDLMRNQEINRLPGIGLLYSELVDGIPPIFARFVETIPSIHSVLVFVSIKHIPVSSVAKDERFLFRQLEPKENRMFRCVVRYGYKDPVEDPKAFENSLIEELQSFIHQEFIIHRNKHSGRTDESGPSVEHIDEIEEEKQFLRNEKEKGVLYLLGETEVIAENNSSAFKRMIVNYVYSFIRRNFRQGQDYVLSIPRRRLLKVGMTYEV